GKMGGGGGGGGESEGGREESGCPPPRPRSGKPPARGAPADRAAGRTATGAATPRGSPPHWRFSARPRRVRRRGQTAGPRTRVRDSETPRSRRSTHAEGAGRYDRASRRSGRGHDLED